MRVWSWMVFVAGLTAALLGAPERVRADDAAQARFHHQRATQSYVAGRYDAALEEFFAVQRLAPSPGTLFNIARCFERLGRAEETYLFYAEYLASDDDDDRLRESAEAVLARLAPRVARIRVVTEPPGAAVYVDQQDRGRYGLAPTVVAVAPGARAITAELEGYRPVRAEVQAVRGQEQVVELTLERVLGRLTVNGPAEGVYRLLDAEGETVAEAALGQPVTAPPERYVLVVQADGHRPWRSIAEVEADAAREVQATPQRLPPPSGAVTVTANRSGALVRLDDEEVGFAPLALTAVPVGEYRLSVSYDGVRPWEGQLIVNANEQAWVTTTLTPPPSTRRSPLSYVFAGIGAGALVAGSVFAVLARNRRNRWENERDAFADPVTLTNLRNETETFNLTADVLMVGGGVSFGVGLLLFFLTEERQDEAASAEISREPR